MDREDLERENIFSEQDDYEWDTSGFIDELEENDEINSPTDLELVRTKIVAGADGLYSVTHIIEWQDSGEGYEYEFRITKGLET